MSTSLGDSHDLEQPGNEYSVINGQDCINY